MNALVLNNTVREFLQQQSCYIKTRSRGASKSLLVKCVSGNSTFFVWQILLICKVQLKYFSNGIFPFQPLNTKLLCPCCHQKVFALTNNTDFHPSTISFLLIFILLKWNISPNPSDAATAVILLCPRNTGELSAVLPKQWQQSAPTCIYPNETQSSRLCSISLFVIPGTITTSLLFYLIHSVACTSYEISDFSRGFLRKKPASRQGNLL